LQIPCISAKKIVERDLRPGFGHLKVAAVTRQDVHKFHAGQSYRPRQANLILAVCSKAFNLAELWEMRSEGSNPCSKIQRYPERHRERFLSAEELGRLGATLRRAESEGLPWKNGGRTLYRRVITGAIELLLYTGCRLSEVLSLRWDHIDFSTGVITLSETKSGGPQLVTINAPARQVLKALEAGKGTSEWVLPSVSSPSSLFRRPGSKRHGKRLGSPRSSRMSGCTISVTPSARMRVSPAPMPSSCATSCGTRTWQWPVAM
jgi:integrase